MFANTITLKIAAVDYVLNRVNQDSYGSEYNYSGATQNINLKIRHSTDKADGDGIVMRRHNVFVEQIVFPTPTAAMKKSSTTITLRHGRYDDPAIASDLSKAVSLFLGTGTNTADLAAGMN